MKDDKQIRIAKLSIYSLLIVVFVILYILLPKKILSKDDVYALAISMADVVEEDLVPYDYKVYSTEARYNAGLENDVPVVLAKFKERGEAMAIVIYGEEKKIEFNDEYWIIHDPEAIELNIDYCLIPNFKFGNYALPVRSAVLTINNIMEKVSLIYLCIVTTIFVTSLVPPTIGVVRAVLGIINDKKIVKTEDGLEEQANI